MKIRMLIEIYSEDESLETGVQMERLIDLSFLPVEKTHIRISPQLNEATKNIYGEKLKKIRNVESIFRVSDVYLDYPQHNRFDAEIICEPLYEDDKDQVDDLLEFLILHGFEK